MQLLWIKSKTWLWISLAFVVCYIILGYTETLLYHVNDDPLTISIVKGGEFRTPYTHSILGWILASLYSWNNDFYWYGLIIVIIYCLAIFRFFYLFNAYGILSAPAAILLICCLLVGFIPFQPNFTFIAWFLSVCAVLPFLMGDKEEFRCSSWSNILISSLFIFIACLYRSLPVFMMVGCALGIHILLAGCQLMDKCKEGNLRHFWRRAGIMFGMASFALLMFATNQYTFTSPASPPEYARFIEFDKYRRGFTDFNKYNYDKTFKEVGISKNDFDLMSGFLGIDSPPLHLENIRKLSAASILDGWRLKDCLRIAYETLTTKRCLFLLAIICCASLLSRRALIASGICLAATLAIVIVTCRMHFRVCLPFLAFGAIISIFFLSPKLKMENLRKSGVRYGLLLFLAFTLALFFTAKLQYNYLGDRFRQIDMETRIWEFCQQNNIDSVAFWALATSEGNERIFATVKPPRSPRIDLIGDYTGSYPQKLKELREIYGKDIYAGLAQPGTYHLILKKKQPIFETFVKEHGAGKAEPIVLFETKRTALYQIKRKDPKVRVLQ
jgi:hypothetical protein